MNQWMQVAYDEAVEGMLANDGGPFGAVIVKDGEIIARAHNRVLQSNDPTAHAEVNVIRDASRKLGTFDLAGCEFYASCMPCPMCLGAVFWTSISVVYYGATEYDAARAGFDDHRFYERICGKDHQAFLKQIDGEETALLFDQWLEKTDRQRY